MDPFVTVKRQTYQTKTGDKITFFKLNLERFSDKYFVDKRGDVL